MNAAPPPSPSAADPLRSANVAASARPGPRSALGRWLVVLLVLAAGAAGYWWWRSGTHSHSDAATFVARRGPLRINILQGGSIRAVESQEIKCEARVGYQGIKILRIVEEGYEVTDQDIRTNKVLVDLDSSDLQKQVVQQDIQFESAGASLTDAQQAYEIQLNQNLSDIKAAEQKVRFARMDFDKYLGDSVTQGIIDQLCLERELAAEQTNATAMATAVVAAAPHDAMGGPAPGPDTNAKSTGSVTVTASNAPPAATNPSPPAVVATNSAPSILIDFSKYAKIDLLGDGEAKQKLRKFEDDLQVARKEEGQAQVSLEGTRRLFEKGYVTKMDLERDDIANENSRLKVQTAVTARDLFSKYEFPKTAEEALSKYTEAVRELTRARKAAVSKLAQAEAKLKSAQGQYTIQARQRKDLYEQLDKCIIRATKPGLVVYGSGADDQFFGGGEERIRQGATVREQQAIITIPDMTHMSVRVRIHESYIKKIKKGQKARITVDAFADKVLDGEVSRVGVLPDSQNMWMNPDMKVYLTTITIAGTNDWLKPGMTAKVDILANELTNVVYVPIQAVAPFERKQVCYVLHGRSTERREVEVGDFNDEFIEIKTGLREGEAVVLQPPETPAHEKPEEAPPKPSLKVAPAAPPGAQARLRSAGGPTCCVADCQVGRAGRDSARRSVVGLAG